MTGETTQLDRYEEPAQGAGNELEIIAPTGENGNGHHPLEVITAVIGLTRKVRESDTREVIGIARGMGLTQIDELEQLVDISDSVEIIDSSNGDQPEVYAEVDNEPAAVGADQHGDGEPESTKDSDEPRKDTSEVHADSATKHSEKFDLPKYSQTHRGKVSQKWIALDTVVAFFDTQQAAQQDEELFVLHRGDDRSASTTLLKNIEGKLIERGIKDPSSDAFRRMTLTNLLNELQMCGYLVINKQKNAKFIDSIALGQPVKKN